VIPPAWCRKSPKISEVLPLLYLHGLSSSCRRRISWPALEQFLGTGSGLSAAQPAPHDMAPEQLAQIDANGETRAAGAPADDEPFDP
jgi:hypothetical protein